MRDQSNSIREQVSFKQRESHIRDSWNNLCWGYPNSVDSDQGLAVVSVRAAMYCCS